MIPEIAALLAGLILFIGLLAAQVPIAWSLLVSGVIGLYLAEGPRPAEGVLASLPYTTTATYSLVLIPMFVLLGVVVSETGIAGEIFDTANRLVGRLPGGLAMSTVVTSALFGGISGSSVADVATVGRISMREMRRHSYAPNFAAAVVAAGGTVAILIPPSIALVVYGILTRESIGQLLLAGIVPGVITVVTYMVVVYVQVKRKRAFAEQQPVSVATASAPAAAQGVDQTPPLSTAIPSAGPRRAGMSGVLYAVALFVIVMGGIYTGLFTPTEAGSVGALAAIILGALRFARRDQQSPLWTVVGRALSETIAVSVMVFAILVGGSIFTQFLLAVGLPQDVTRAVTGLNLPPILVVVLIVAALIPLGMLLDGLSMLLITVPLAYPIVVTELGFDGVWFGILMVVTIELGLITPPVGLNVFVIAGIDKTLRAERVFAAVIPFMLALVALLALFIAFPDIVTWLPGLSNAKP